MLVVDTTLLRGRPHRGGRTAVGTHKHVVERYQLSDDRTRLLFSAVVEDPDYLAEPLTVSTTWDYAPQQRLLRFACDREQSRRYLFR